MWPITQAIRELGSASGVSGIKCALKMIRAQRRIVLNNPKGTHYGEWFFTLPWRKFGGDNFSLLV